MLGVWHTSRKESPRDYAQKNTTSYIERDEQEREEFRETLNKLPNHIEIFYADESGFNEYYFRTHGYAHRSRRVSIKVRGKRAGRTSVVGAINANNELVAGFAFKGYMNGDLFCGWLEHIFIPSLKDPSNSALIIDNASHHPKDAIQAIADEYGLIVIFLPKYSPDLNPIEKYWANIKNWLRLHFDKYDNFWDGFISGFG